MSTLSLSLHPKKKGALVLSKWIFYRTRSVKSSTFRQGNDATPQYHFEFSIFKPEGKQEALITKELSSKKWEDEEQPAH